MFSQHPVMVVVMESPFTDSCLPLTVETAGLFRYELSRVLPQATRSWPLGDRVVVWLYPPLLKAARRYHSDSGPPLISLCKQSDLEALDPKLLVVLCARLERLHPGAIERARAWLSNR